MTGLRIGEVLNLRREDVDLEDGVITIRDTKFGNHAASLTMFHLDMTSRKF
ncbi:tyrosine-type recombinase/integrase [Burkholderia cenocepacia]|uniref:tyrosine-type recombinase/integrase n=1 Tax=Burkholderia cenocepacia TaxID=95486 RepID=UPI002AB79666|nr:tyrosine-type recombinase/integrase [Burkholderia cenocepacia]